MSFSLADFEKEIALVQVKARYDAGAARLQGVFDLALLWLRSMLLIAGGGVIALITVLNTQIGGSLDRLALVFAIALFGLAALLTLLALIVGWNGQDWFHLSATEKADFLVASHLKQEKNSDGEEAWASGKAWSDWAVRIAALALLALALAVVVATYSARSLVSENVSTSPAAHAPQGQPALNVDAAGK